MNNETIDTVEGCDQAITAILANPTYLPAFSEHLTTIQKQIKRYNKKEDAILGLLLQKFDEQEMTYRVFRGTLVQLKELFETKIKPAR